MKDIYVKFSGKFKVDGESADSEHAKWVEVDSWAHQIMQPRSATASSAGGHTAERCEHGDMQFVKSVDQTSPKMWEACSAGHTFDEVVIDFMRADGGKRVKYLEIKLKHVLVSSVAPHIAGEGVPSESFSLKYAAIQWTYTAQGIAGGAKGNTAGAWSLAKNTNKYEA
ncbi:Hcp family type VI secretion system effector [Chitinimonas sp. BJB300]|uniref:Hcp family type VI secretion system effector n=1 Tax=Chitinimonas sp. BJB300 TaxID=1559339 RepID=UPI000C0CDABB|nr:type VI secretion system tube protein Hcp [Chitinimonas sp. BJB300]PHV13180.1 type VI secretion system tube protein Hcp [Chitinimonas sp. BJB300]TSJ87162.1 type VI secretion system tube protein Hcp [Chitinimonas sp. BJB300]